MTVTETGQALSAEPVTAKPVLAAAAPARGLVRLPTRRPDEAAGSRWRVPRGVERLAGVVLLFAGWQLASSAGWLSPRVLAGPSAVVTVGWDLARDGTLWAALQASLWRVLWGLGLGVPIGVVLALASGLTRVGDDLVDANIQMLRFVPIIGIQPLLILWLGLGETAKISLIVMGVAFPIYVNTSVAIKSLHPGYRELADVAGLGRAGLIRHVVIPGALPSFLVGLRLAAAVAWLLLVFAEQLNAHSGIGYLMIRAQTFFQSDVIVLCLVIYALLGLITDGLIRLLDRRVLRWQPGR
ncbi:MULTISPECIES: ABC transporter permease [unclassified Frankia]|uniref:ABC transporter permease n=1 Tax=unclassified Frankia TaxID=2632575 RepID=UPI0027DE61F4|nr:MULTISPECIES: ABC transporter permease [unclassified Frankia]